MKKLMMPLLVAFAFMVGISNASAQYSYGNIVALVAASNSANNTTASVIEVNPSTANQSSPVNTTAVATTLTNFKVSGSATSTMYLSHTADLSLISFTGVTSTSSANVNTLGVSGGATVVSVSNNRTVTSATTYSNTSGNQVRSATSLDNSTWWIGDQGGFYTNNATSASPSGNVRAVKPFGGVVYAGGTSTTVYPVSTISAATGGTLTGLPGLSAAYSANFVDFYLIQSGSNGSAYDVLYVMDSKSATNDTIYKYSLVAGTWTGNGYYACTVGGFGLCASAGSGSANLYISSGNGATSANKIVKLTDAAGYNSTISITTGNNVTLYTAASGTTIKGIDFAPYTYPTISAQPTSTQSVYQNVAASNLSVTAVAGSGSLSTYAWYYNSSNANTGGTAITSGNSATYGTGYNTSTLTPNTATVGTIYYYCVVTDANGATVTSNTAAVIVSSPPAGYYWNGGNAGSTSISGGTGTWSATGTGASAWVNSTGPTSTTWSDGNAAIFTGTAGNVTLGSGSSTTTVAPSSVEFSTTNYNLYTNSTYYNAINSNISVDAGLNLNVFNPTQTTLQYLAFGGNLTGGAGSSVTLQGVPQAATGSVANLIELTKINGTVSIPTITVAAGSATTGGNKPGVIGLEAYLTAGTAGSPNSMTVSSNLVNNNTSITGYPLMLGSQNSYTVMNVTGNISGSGDVQISSGYSSGGGIVNLSGNNTYSGVTYINGYKSGSTTYETLQLGSTTALPTTTSVIFANPNSSNTGGGTLDLNGYSPTIAGLSSSARLNTTSNIINSNATASTLTVNIASGTNTLALPINNGTGTVGLSLTGAGTFVLSSASSFSGGLSVSGGGTFQTGVATAFSGSPALTLSNGTYSTGASTGYTATLGTLSVGASNATIALGTGVHTLTFSDSHSLTWGAGSLTITGWTGYGFSGATAGKIMVGVGGLSSTQLSKITFSGYSGTPMILSTGELVPYYASPNITGQPSTGTQTVCQSGSLTALSVTASAGSAAISTYQWYSNTSASTSGSTSVSTGTGYSTNTFTPSTASASALYYYCVVTDANGATSTSGFSGLITVSANVTPTVTITPTSVSTCSASSSTINFSINNTTFSGASPSYVWKKVSGGSTSQVATGTTYSPLPSAFSNGDQVYAVMTSNYSCLTTATAQSASTTLTITTSVAPTVTASNSVTNSVSSTATICNGTSVTFTATNVNSVGSPSYQWYDGITTVGTNSATYTTSSISNNDQIKVVMSTSDVCASSASGTSGITTVTVNPTLTPSAVVSASANPVCTGTAVSFSATTLTNCGSSPTYLWYKNSVSTGITTATYNLASPTNNDAVYAVVTPSSDVCTVATATSSAVTLTVNTTLPTIGTITANSGAIYSTQSLSVGITTYTNPTVSPAPTFQWYDNAVAITGATASTYTTTSLSTGTHPLTLKITDANACSATSAAQSISVLAPTTFTAGNIVVERVGDNATASTGSTGSKIFIDQYNTTGTSQTAISSVALPWSIGTSTYPTYPSAANYSLTTSESATSEGFLTLSSDGSYLSVPGYNAYYTETGVASSTCSAANTSNYRAVGVVSSNGVATVPIAANVLSGNNIRGVVSDGTQFWVNGAAGFYYFSNSSDNTGTQYAGSNLRALGIFNGTLYTTSGSSPYVGLNTLGTTASLHDNGTVSQQLIAPGSTNSTSPYGFVFNPTGDAVYIADDAKGIIKYTTTDGVNYTFAYVLTTTVCRGIIGDFSGTNPVLYATTASATTGNTIIKVTDAGSAGATPTTLATATASNTVFKGIAWAPAATQNSYFYVNKTFRGTALNAAFGSSTIGTAVTNSGYNFFGLASKFIPASATVTVTPPVGYEISTSAAFGTVYTNSSPLTISGASLAESSSSSIYQIYVRFRPTVSGTQNGNITIASNDGHTTQATVSVTGSGLLPTTYYYSGSGSLTSPSSYKDGSGNTCLESSISNTGITWYIQTTGSYTLTAPFSLGTNSTLYVGGGSGTTTLTVPSGDAISSGLGINLAATGVLDWNDASTPSFANIASGSTVNYGGSGISQTIAVGNYSNIILTGSGARVFSASTYTIDNNFSVGSSNTVTTTGSTIYFNGTTAQNVPGITYNNLTLSSNTTTTATGNITTNGTLYIEQGTFTIPAGYTYTQLGSVVTVGSTGNTCSLTVNGTFNNGSSTVSAATISITSGSSISFNASTSVYNHLGDGGSFPKATWNAGSTANITGIKATAPASGFAQSFGNFTWNNTSQTAAISINTSSFATQGTLTVASTGSSYLALVGTIATTYSNTFANINATGGTFYTSYISAATNNCVENLTVTGNVSVSGTAVVNLAGGSSSPSYTSVAYPTNLSIGGNLTVASTAKFYAYNTATTYGVFNHGKVTFTNSVTYSNSGTATGYGHLDYIINSGKVLTLTSNITQRASSSTEYDQITNNGTINLNGNTLTTCGITGGIITGSSASGLIVNGYTNVTLTLDQTTPGTSNALNTLTINTTGTVTVANGLNITGILTPTAGTLALGTGNVTLKSTSIANSAVVGLVGGTITGTATVERYIPSTWRAFRDLGAAGVYASGNTIYNTWQESGSYSQSGHGLFITGATSTAGSSYGSNHVDNGTGGTYLDYSLNSYPSAYYWNATKQSFDTVKNTNTTSLNPFQSYRVLVRGDRGFDLYTSQILNYPNGLRMYDATALRTTGSLIYGNVTYSSTGVTNSVTGSAYTSSTYGLSSTASGYSYITNPYDCPIDYHNIYSNGRIANMIYGYWYLDPTVAATGAYVAYNAVAGTTNLGYSNGNFIQAGQGFLVANYHVDGTHLPSIQITENDKSTATSSRTSVFGVEAPTSKLFVGLLKESTRVDGVAVVFGNNFSNGIGLEDSRKLSGGTDNISIKEGSDYLSIDGRLPATSSDVLGIYMGKPSTTSYQLRVDASGYINEGYAPLLYDAYKNTTRALSGIDTVSFTVDASTAATYANRFSIIFTPSALAVNSIVASATLNNKVATITWNTVGEKGESYFEVEKSTDGKNFASIGHQATKNTASANYSTTDNSVAEGNNYYRIKAVSETGAVNYSNVAKLTNNSPLTTYSLYPNPLVGKTLNVALNNVASGKYVVSIYNVLGEKVIEQTISHSGGSTTHALTINNMLARGIYSVTIREASSNQIVHQTSLSVQP